MIECHISAQPRTPFCHYVSFHPQGSVSLDSRVASLPYESSSLATSRGNEKIGGTGYCVTYDTDSQSRNVLASPLGEEGHEVAKGCTRVRMIMILDVDVTAEGGITKLIAQEGDTTTLGAQGPVKLKNPPAKGRSILRTFFYNPSTQPAASAAPPFFIICARRAPPQPSARRAVKPKNLKNPRAKGPSTLTPQVCPSRKYDPGGCTHFPYHIPPVQTIG